MMFWKNRCRYCWGDHRKVSLCAGAMVESLRAEIKMLVEDMRFSADAFHQQVARAEAAEERVKQLEASAAAWGLKVWDNR
jgi:hypothetical protein